MVDTEYLPNRPLTEGELEDFVETQGVECPLAFHSHCMHCDTEGVVDALVRDGRQVYALHHGWDEWELKTLERDMDPEMFRMMVSRLDPAMLRQFGGDQLPDVEADVESEFDLDQIGDDIDFDPLPATEGTEVLNADCVLATDPSPEEFDTYAGVLEARATSDPGLNSHQFWRALDNLEERYDE